MAEATPSGRGFWEIDDTFGRGWKGGGSPGRFALPWGEKRLATKDHIEHIEHDREMNWHEKRRLTGDGSPYLADGLLQVGMSVPAHPLWVRGKLRRLRSGASE